MKLYCRKYIFMILFLVLSTQCSVFRNVCNAPVVKNENRTTDNSILNYEDTAKELNADVLKERYKIHVEIERPYIISFKKRKLPSIYRISSVTGISIVKAEIDEKGNMVTHKIIRSAGLGLDEITNDLLKSMILSPAYHEGIPSRSVINIKIIYKGTNRI